MAGGLALLLSAIRDDGRIRVAPRAPLYPCYTAEAARTLCRFDLVDQPEVQRTLRYFLESTHEEGGWRCSFTKFGKGPETQCASPGATLYVLDALRFLPSASPMSAPLQAAVESLLNHWEGRVPVGPCHHGGSRFLQVEYPFIRYNLFYYVYVLSFFESARTDPRFRSALAQLVARLSDDGEVVVEQPHRGLKRLAFCAKGKPSARATGRYREILENVGD